MIKNLKRGDKMYNCFNGKLEVSTFTELSINKGCSMPTVKGVQEDWTRFQCDPSMYYETVKEAYEQYLKECQESIPGQTKAIEKAKQCLKESRDEVKRIKELLRAMQAR